MEITANKVSGEASWSTQAAKAISETTQKVINFVKAIFVFIKDLVLFPTRYMGSKTWSLPGIALRFLGNLLACICLGKPFNPSELVGTGYHRDTQLLSKEEVKPYIKYGCMAAGVHSNNSEWTEPFGLKLVGAKALSSSIEGMPEGIEAHEHSFFDPDTALKINIYEDETTTYIAFGALGSYESEVQKEERSRFKRIVAMTGASNLVGFSPAIYEKANAAVEALKNYYEDKGKKIQLVGQCFGGAIASYVALKQGVKAVCLNTMALGVGLQYDIGHDRLKQADEYVTHISANKDLFSDTPVLVNCVDTVFNLVGLRTQGNFGKRLMVPSAYKSIQETHDYILGSMMVHAGFDMRNKPADLKDRPEANAIFGIVEATPGEGESGIKEEPGFTKPEPQESAKNEASEVAKEFTFTPVVESAEQPQALLHELNTILASGQYVPGAKPAASIIEPGIYPNVSKKNRVRKNAQFDWGAVIEENLKRNRLNPHHPAHIKVLSEIIHV